MSQIPHVVVALSTSESAGFPPLLNRLTKAGFVVISRNRESCGCLHDLGSVVDAAIIDCTGSADCPAVSTLRLARAPVAPVCYLESASSEQARMLLAVGAISVLQARDQASRAVEAVQVACAVTRQLRQSTRVAGDAAPPATLWLRPFARDYELTPMEAEILECFCELGDQSETARALGKKVRSVRFHLENIAVKCGCDKQKQLLPHVLAWLSRRYIESPAATGPSGPVYAAAARPFLALGSSLGGG